MLMRAHFLSNTHLTNNLLSYLCYCIFSFDSFFLLTYFSAEDKA